MWLSWGRWVTAVTPVTHDIQVMQVLQPLESSGLPKLAGVLSLSEDPWSYQSFKGFNCLQQSCHVVTSITRLSLLWFAGKYSVNIMELMELMLKRLCTKAHFRVQMFWILSVFLKIWSFNMYNQSGYSQFFTKTKNYQNCFSSKKINPINSIDPLITRSANTWH